MRQYAFQPQPTDPRITAQDEWARMVDELDITRDSLERSNAECTSQAALIDMLRKELAETRIRHDRDQEALTIMRTKLKAAGGLVLDALKESPQEPQEKPIPIVRGLPAHTPEPGPAVSLAVEDDSARETVNNIHSLLTNKFP